MGDMSWLSHLVTTDSRKELEDYLQCKGFQKPKYAAEQFLKAQKEIEEKEVPVITGNKDTDSLLEDERASQDGELTTADKYNKEWLDEKGSES